MNELLDACGNCQGDLSIGWPDYCHEPESMYLVDGGVACLYRCPVDGRQWATTWNFLALDSDTVAEVRARIAGGRDSVAQQKGETR